LPPIDRGPSEVAAFIANPTLGLPPPERYEIAPYHLSLSLEGVGQPSVALGASPFGVAVGGGVSFNFSDMLGNHTLATALQFNSGFGGNFSVKDTAAQVAYFNQAHRWNWGAIMGQVPYLSGGFQTGVGTTPEGEPIKVDHAMIYRQTERSASGMVSYPFDRTRRVEFQAGATQISFDQRVETTITSLNTFQILSDNSASRALGQALTLGTSSAAFVYDTANFGATSPVQGQRYRFEVAPTFGSIHFTNLLADYRHYFMPAPFYTLAARVIHYGRYGSGGEDPRLLPLYIGYPNLVRGYDVNTFDTVECFSTATSDCPPFDRLLGSRVLVGNVEFRFPLLRPFGVSRRMYGPLPVEAAIFADGGVAWNRRESPSFVGGARTGVSSAGVALRVSLSGFAVGEFNFSRPLQRPGKGWVFQFNLSPGF
jgi:hypothetical protein